MTRVDLFVLGELHILFWFRFIFSTSGRPSRIVSACWAVPGAIGTETSPSSLRSASSRRSALAESFTPPVHTPGHTTRGVGIQIQLVLSKLSVRTEQFEFVLNRGIYIKDMEESLISKCLT